MRARLLGPLCALLILLPRAAAAEADTRWMSVHLDGSQIGYLKTTRSESDGQVFTTQVLDLTVERDGAALRVRSVESSVETADGRPLRFGTESDMAGSSTRIDGRLERGMLLLDVHSNGQTQRRRMPWPAGALLAEGQRLAAQRAGLATGSSYEVLAFDTSSLSEIRIRTEVGALETVTLHGVTEELVALRQHLSFGEGALTARAWVDADGRQRRVQLPMMGLLLEMQACDEACALAPVQRADVLASTVVRAPRGLSAAERNDALHYRLRIGGADPAALGQVPGQRLLDGHALPAGAGSDEFWLEVSPRGAAGEPLAEHLAPTRWLESDAEPIRRMARRATRGSQTAAVQMQKLERAVRQHIRNKSLRVGYASALETLHAREGDCTEHAVLLAALGRAVGIPTRVATGLAYAAEFGGQRNVFVPHAWVLAWVDGQWHGYDAALPGFGAGHIALAAGDGDPFRFYQGVDLLGRIGIVDVRAVAPGAAALGGAER